MDVLQGVQDAQNELPEGADFVAPTLEQMLEALKGMDIPEKEKEDLLQSLLSGAGGGGEGFLPPEGGFSTGYSIEQLSVFLGAISIIVVVFVFFGYKLYKSLVDKERKRDEKRKQKQLKKRR